MIRFVQQRPESLWCLDKPGSQKHHCVIAFLFDLWPGRGMKRCLRETGLERSPNKKSKNLTLPGNESTQNPLTIEHIAASKMRKAPAFGAKKVSDDSTPPSFLLTAKPELFRLLLFDQKANLKIKSIIYSATESLKHQANTWGRDWDAFSQLYMAQILKYKQGLTTRVSLTTVQSHVYYTNQTKKNAMLSQCALLLLLVNAEIFTYMITCVCVCVFAHLHTRVCGRWPWEQSVGVLLVCVLCFLDLQV